MNLTGTLVHTVRIDTVFGRYVPAYVIQDAAPKSMHMGKDRICSIFRLRESLCESARQKWKLINSIKGWFLNS